MNKCIGCGALLQDIKKDGIGYTKNINSKYCERCFRIKNYHDYKLVDIDNDNYISILKSINLTNELVILVVDLFNIGKELEVISKYINNNILLVLTKRDILPLSIYDNNIENYFNDYKLNIIDKVIISSKNNYNFDLLYKKILKYKTDNIYVVGFTNAGKSTMINKLIYNYTNNDTEITTSYLRSTTLNKIEINFNDFKLIDTPGLLDNGNITNYLDLKYLDKIIPKQEIKPRIYQIKSKQSIIVDKLLRVDVDEKNILVFYMSNKLEFLRIYKDSNKLTNLKKHIIDVRPNFDIVINGLGFIKVKEKAKIVIYTLDNVLVYTRKSLI